MIRQIYGRSGFRAILEKMSWRRGGDKTQKWRKYGVGISNV
jgi:hypothetical protein